MAGKGAAMTGGAATLEAIESASNTLTPQGLWAKKGLQQHYSPPEASQLAFEVMGHKYAEQHVCDLTAGDGALLEAWPQECRFGIEIDHDQIRAGRYHAIHGDVQQVYPMLRVTRMTFPVMVLNPPFGLTWTDTTGKKVNSTLQTLRYGLGLLAAEGQGMMVAGRDRFLKDVMGTEEARGVWAIIECPDLFDGVELPCVLAFFVKPSNRKNEDPPIQLSCTREQLPEQADPVLEALRDRARYIARPHSSGNLDRVDRWKTVAAEHRQRRDARERSRQASHDVTIRDGKLRVQLSPFAQLALANEYAISQKVRGLHGQSVSYFAYNAREWRVVQSMAAAGKLTVHPDVGERIEKIIGDAQKMLVPCYPLRPQQWLGYLDDLDSIVCIKGDPEKGYTAGERYSLSVDSKTSTEHGSKLVTTRSGDTDARRFRHVRKLLAIRIGEHTFDEGAENILYLLEHFDVPDPGDLETLYPGDVEAMREVLRLIERAYGLNDGQPLGPPKVGTDGKPLYRKRWSFKPFQIEDLARLLVKHRGLLAWEQGLGKTLGMMALAVALEILGDLARAGDPRFRAFRNAQKGALFVIPQDLIPQWEDEAWQFFGREFTVIRDPAHAHQVAEHVANGGEGWFIVHMEGLSITGKRDVSMNMPVGKRLKRDQMPQLIVCPQDYYALPSHVRAHAVKHPHAPYMRVRELTESARNRALQKGETFDLPELLASLDFLTTNEACPMCLAHEHDGWNRKTCSRGPSPDERDKWRPKSGTDPLPKHCGYVHKRQRVHTSGHWLSTAFRRGAIFVDEITNAAGASLRADAVAALHADYRFGGTGTPIKNYVNDIFKILWWCLGNASERFPYDYLEGRGKFENDFCVIEYLQGSDDSGRERRKVLPKVTNLSMLWRLLSGGMIRRRKQDTGEPLVPMTIHPVWTPAGVAQSAFNKAWAGLFERYFIEMNPDHPIVLADLVGKYSAALGLQWKLEYASTLPMADPSLDWLLDSVDDEVSETLAGLSNFTPANLQALEIAMREVRAGKKVVIFSDLIATGQWFAELLQERGVNATHIVEEHVDDEGNVKAQTMPPRKRAARLKEFRHGDVQVLCTGIKAVKQGHNLDTASVAIVVGQEFSHESKEQAIARVHRLTSKAPVDIYMVMPGPEPRSATENEPEVVNPFMAAKKWVLLNDKQGASDLALDGELIGQDHKEISWQEAIEDMKRKGFALSGDEVDEFEVHATWKRAEGMLAHIAKDGKTYFFPVPGQLLIPALAGNRPCDDARQLRMPMSEDLAPLSEREAFDAYHRFADQCARNSV